MSAIISCKSDIALFALSTVCLKFNAAILSVVVVKLFKTASIFAPLFLKLTLIDSTLDKILDNFELSAPTKLSTFLEVDSKEAKVAEILVKLFSTFCWKLGFNIVLTLVSTESILAIICSAFFCTGCTLSIIPRSTLVFKVKPSAAYSVLFPNTITIAFPPSKSVLSNLAIVFTGILYSSFIFSVAKILPSAINSS